MALYKEQSADWLNNILATGEENRKQRQLDLYAAQKESTDRKYSNGNGGLGGFLSNLFRDIKSVGNTAATTAAAYMSKGVQDANNAAMKDATTKGKEEQDRIAREYGYSGVDEAYDKGDGPDEMWEKLQNATKATRQNVEKIDNDYKNNWAVNQINNTKQSQYGADALRTLNLGFNVMAPGVAATPLGGAISGAVGGVADSLENADGTVLDLQARTSGGKIGNTENATIDGADMLKRAAIGGGVGAITAGAGNKIGNAKSVVGSKLLNNRLITSGVGRGATSGALGGALSSGAYAALEGGDVGNAALQGALSGGLSGGVAGGVMSGAKKAGSSVANKLGISDKLNAIKQELTYDPERQAMKQVAQPEEVAKATTTADDEFRAYGDSDLANQTTKNKVASKLRKYGETMEGSQSNVTRRQAEKLGIESPGKTIDKLRKRTGIGDIDTQAQLAKELTGGENSLLDNIQKRALSATEDGSGRFTANTDNLLSEAEGIIRRELSPLGEETVNKEISKMRYGLSSKESSLLDKANYYEGLAADIKGKGQNKQEGDTAKLRAYKQIAKNLEDRSYSAIPESNVKDMVNVATNELRSRSKQAEANGNTTIAKAYSMLADEMKNVKTIGEYRTFKKDFVDAAKLDKLTLQAENGAAQNMAQSAGGIKRKLENVALGRALNAGLAKGGAVLSNAADYLDNRSSKAATVKTPTPTRPTTNTMQTVYNLIGQNAGRTEGAAAVDDTRKNQAFSNLESQLAYNMSDQGLASVPGLVSSNAIAQQNSGLAQAQAQLADISNGMNLALAAGDIDSYNKLASLYQTAYKMYEMQYPQTSSSKEVKLSDTQKKANTAMDLLNELESLNADFGYAVRDIPLLNLVNIGGNNYANTADALASELGYMLSGATIKDDELQKIKDEYVPQPFDSEATKQAKLRRARNIIQQYQNTYTSDAA